MRSILTVSIFMMITTSLTVVAAEDYVCDNNGVKRIVSIVYHNEEAPVPCEVRYDKGEGMQTLWTAESEAGYCEARADEFIGKQETWGFKCSKFEAPNESDGEMSQVDMQEPAMQESQELMQEELHTSVY